MRLQSVRSWEAVRDLTNGRSEPQCRICAAACRRCEQSCNDLLVTIRGGEQS
jgi:hypothetical protein